MPSVNPERELSFKMLTGLCLAAVWLVICLLAPAQALANSGDSQATPSVLPGIPLAIALDGQPYPLHFLAFENGQECPMISLSDCQQLFGLDVELNDNGVLTLQGSGHLLQLPSASYVHYSSWSTLALPGGQSVRLDIIYLPLKPVAEEWQHKLIINPETATAVLYSPEFGKKTTNAPPVTDLLPDGLPAWGSFAAASSMNNLWPDEKILGGYYTTITNSSANRINNIVLSCSSMNGKVIRPGEVFAFNRTVGQRTTQRGYRIAPVYSGKKVVSGIGGGICQTSTTLYNAARECGMQVLERHHHTLPVHYIASGNDATVSWGTADFRFRNNKEYSIRILAQVYKNYVIFAIARAD